MPLLVISFPLSQAYEANAKAFRSYLSQSSLQLPHYSSLDWRLDVEVGSRCIRNIAQPSYLLELKTKVCG